MKRKIIAISGSTRKQSSNLNLIYAIETLTKDIFEIDIFNETEGIPNFNPDKDNNEPPAAVAAFRNRLSAADGILICTPEYAMGVPGALKNAIDWTVSSCEFSHKPTALITASSMGQKGHAALMETLKVIEAEVSEETQLIISFVKTKVSADATITDTGTLESISNLLAHFHAAINATKVTRTQSE